MKEKKVTEEFVHLCGDILYSAHSAAFAATMGCRDQEMRERLSKLMESISDSIKLCNEIRKELQDAA